MLGLIPVTMLALFAWGYVQIFEAVAGREFTAADLAMTFVVILGAGGGLTVGVVVTYLAGIAIASWLKLRKSRPQ